MPGLRSHPGDQGGREWAVGDPFPGPACGSGLSFSYFNDQFLVLEKKKKAKEREFEIYRKKYQCFVFVVFRLLHVHTLPSSESLLQLLIQLLHHRLAPATRADSWDVGSRLASSETRTFARAVLLSLPSPARPSLPTHPLLPATHWVPKAITRSCLSQACLWTLCWGRALLGSS